MIHLPEERQPCYIQQLLDISQCFLKFFLILTSLRGSHIETAVLLFVLARFYTENNSEMLSLPHNISTTKKYLSIGCKVV